MLLIGMNCDGCNATRQEPYADSGSMCLRVCVCEAEFGCVAKAVKKNP